MAFSYQKNFAQPTENVTPELMGRLLDDHNSRWLTQRIRQIKATAATRDWRTDADYQDWQRRQKDEVRQTLAESSAETCAQRWADSMKKQLPLVTFVASFDEMENSKGVVGRWRQQKACRLNGLSVMDLDHVVQTHDGEAVRAWWKEHTCGLDLREQGIVMAYISASGDGLKVVFKARMEWGNLIDNQFFMAQMLYTSVDKSCKDGSRGHFLTTREDLLYFDETDFYTYYNDAFNQKWNEQYRSGGSQPTLFDSDGHALPDGGAHGKPDPVGHATAAAAGGEGAEADAPLTYHGVEYQKIVEAWLEGRQPERGDRHKTSLVLADHLRYITDNDAALIERVLRQTPFVADLLRERGEDVAGTVRSALAFKMDRYTPRRMREALRKVGIATDSPATATTATSGTAAANDAAPGLPLAEWGADISKLFGEYPCLQAVCDGQHPAAYPAVLFASAAFLGTLMTRTWYHFYHLPEEERRLNYSIYIIGDPASGKSVVGRLYRLLAAPIIAADKVANDAINNYKRELKARASSSKEQKKEALRQPEVMVRIHGARTANGVFIEDMVNAVEIVGDRPMHLHMLTFDAELDSMTAASRGGQWIDKGTMELKAFHNEEDSQQYKNVDSVTGPFDVFWNYIYTGTPISLRRKVTERNFGSGLSTRLACIPLPSSNFQMMALEKPRTNVAALEEMKTWAYRLDGVSGELPLWPLVEQCWEWTRDHMKLAEINQDKADELLLKRVPYYGIAVAAPFMLMRHWEEWQAKKTFTVDDTDHRLCELAMNIQYRCQHYYFGEYAHNYFDNMDSDPARERNRQSKTKIAYGMLPETFTLEDVEKHFGTNNGNARTIVSRLVKDGYVERDGKAKRGVYAKKVLSL